MKHNVKKPYSSWKGVAYVLDTVWREERFLFILSVFRIPVLVLLPFGTIYLSKLLVQMVEEQVPVSRMLLEVGMLALGLVLLNVFKSSSEAVSKSRQQILQTNFIHKVFQKVMDTDYENVESAQGQTKRQKANSHDYNGYGVGLNHIMTSAVMVVACICGFLLYGIILSALNPLIFVLLIVITAVNYFVLTSVRKYEASYLDRRAVYERRLSYLIRQGQDVKNGKDIRLYRMVSWFLSLFRTALKGRDREVWLFVKRQSLAATVNYTLEFIRDGLAYAYLIYLALANRIQVSDFVLYIGLISGFSTWIKDLIDHLNWLGRSGLIASNVREYLELPDYLNRGQGAALPKEEELPCELEFRDVTFSYPGAKTPVFEHFNLKVHPGEKLALVGINGAGKTTLVKLLCGLYRPDSGKILINGKEIKEYNRDTYYTLFSTAFQDVYLMPLSIAQNVAMCPANQVDRERVWKCLEQAGLEEKVRSWKEGLDTMLVKGIFDEAVDLSGGERQKLVFARALYRNAPILILDEPTAALDPIAENQMYLKYSEVARGKTSVFISHRLSSTSFCDRILLIENGKIAEEGSHEELMAQNGSYAKMFEIQSHYYKKDQQILPEESEVGFV